MISKIILFLGSGFCVLLVLAEILQSSVVETLKNSELFAAIIGAFIYHFAKFRIFKDKEDKTKAPTNNWVHFQQNYDDWIWSIGFIMVLYFWGDLIIGDFYLGSIETWWYLGTALVADLIFYEPGKALGPWIKRLIINGAKKIIEGFVKGFGGK